MKFFAALRATRADRAAAEARTAVREIERIKAQPDRPIGDALSWPLPGLPQEPPALFDVLCCPATSPLGGRCERKTGHRARSHVYALPVDDVLDVRLCVWKADAKAKATA